MEPKKPFQNFSLSIDIKSLVLYFLLSIGGLEGFFIMNETADVGKAINTLNEALVQNQCSLRSQ